MEKNEYLCNMNKAEEQQFQNYVLDTFKDFPANVNFRITA